MARNVPVDMSRHEPAAERFGRLSSNAVARLLTGVEAVAFWGGVLAPLGYLPVLAIDASSTTVAALLGVHVACLIVGHRHHPQFDGSLLNLSISKNGGRR